MKLCQILEISCSTSVLERHVLGDLISREEADLMMLDDNTSVVS